MDVCASACGEEGCECAAADHHIHEQEQRNRDQHIVGHHAERPLDEQIEDLAIRGRGVDASIGEPREENPHATANNLDPYLMAALVAQESTFVADIRSHANAYGLMQLLPSTARLTARKINLRYTTRALTDPELNVRLGMANFATTLKQFGDVYLALASYNAGDRAVRRWMQERPGLEREEFIDDIPYPETQNYVKRILGTAEDYRRLYSPKS